MYIWFIPPFLLINLHHLFHIQFSFPTHRHFYQLLGYLAFHRAKKHLYKSHNGRNQTKNATWGKHMGINVNTTYIIQTLLRVCMLIPLLTFFYIQLQKCRDSRTLIFLLLLCCYNTCGLMKQRQWFLFLSLLYMQGYSRIRISISVYVPANLYDQYINWSFEIFKCKWWPFY